MENSMMKLALWHSRTFRPMITHADLEPIMLSLGFITRQHTPAITSAVEWTEYAFAATSVSRHKNRLNRKPSTATTQESQNNVHPRPRLPFPRIDGLHLLTYKAFIDAVGFYLGLLRVADHFHVRGMPLQPDDRLLAKEFRSMVLENDDEGKNFQGRIFVFRDGTLDQTSNNNGCSNTVGKISYNNSDSNPISLVSLKDVIAYQDIKV